MVKFVFGKDDYDEFGVFGLFVIGLLNVSSSRLRFFFNSDLFINLVLLEFIERYKVFLYDFGVCYIDFVLLFWN